MREVGFVEDVDGGLGERVDLGQDFVDGFDLSIHFWIGNIDDVEEKVGFDRFFQG